jgi:hypothetical protein
MLIGKNLRDGPGLKHPVSLELAAVHESPQKA